MISNRTSLAALMLSSASLSGVMMAAADGGAGDGTESMESETGFLSLAALAGANTDEITTLTSRVPPAGIWRVVGEAVKLSQGEARDDKPAPFRVGFKYLVLHGTATDPNFDNEKMVDRKLQESFTIWADQIEEGIGLLKGRYMKAGIPNTGTLGGVEGFEPGWLDNVVGFEFDLRIRHGQRNGDTVAYYDWQAAEASETADE